MNIIESSLNIMKDKIHREPKYNKTCAHGTSYPGLVSFRAKYGAIKNFDTEYAKVCQTEYQCIFKV